MTSKRKKGPRGAAGRGRDQRDGSRGEGHSQNQSQNKSPSRGPDQALSSRAERDHRAGRPADDRRASMGNEDQRLWQAVARSIDPLEGKARVPDAAAASADAFQRLLDQAERKAGGRKSGQQKPERGSPVLGDAGRADDQPGRGAISGSTDQQRQTKPKPGQSRTRDWQIGASQRASPPVASAVDARQVRRIGRGQMEIDARIDLHGMRQSEAHGALRVFLHRAVTKGHRMVLVITGKGGRRAGTSQGGALDGLFPEGRAETGVLRRNVPLWLGEPDLRDIVVGYTTAHVRHGGEGALYVQIRRRRR